MKITVAACRKVGSHPPFDLPDQVYTKVEDLPKGELFDGIRTLVATPSFQSMSVTFVSDSDAREVSTTIRVYKENDR